MSLVVKKSKSKVQSPEFQGVTRFVGVWESCNLHSPVNTSDCVLSTTRTDQKCGGVLPFDETPDDLDFRFGDFCGLICAGKPAALFDGCMRFCGEWIGV